MRSVETDRQAVEDLIRQLRSDAGLLELWERDAISRYVVPLLRALGWDTDNGAEVEREFQIGMGRVDFLLKGPASRLCKRQMSYSRIRRSLSTPTDRHVR